MQISSPHPWQEKQWQQLQAARASERLPHAILLHGVQGMGKSDFANAMASSLMCDAPTSQHHACGRCAQCVLIAAGNHPDKLSLSPEKPGASLGVDQIRALSEKLSHTLYRSKTRVAIIHHADSMTRSAANALLKTLEEPSRDTIILLLCTNLPSLPATIISRCQRLPFPNSMDSELKCNFLRAKGCDQAEHLLELANGAPLAALAWQEDNKYEAFRDFQSLLMSLRQAADPILVAEKICKVDEADLFDWIINYLHDIIQSNLSDTKDLSPAADSLVADVRKLYQLCDQWLAYKAKWLQGVHLNKQLQCESLCFELQRAIGEAV